MGIYMFILQWDEPKILLHKFAPPGKNSWIRPWRHSQSVAMWGEVIVRWGEEGFYPAYQHLLSERLTSLGIPCIPPLNPSETIVLSEHYRQSLGQQMLELGCEDETVGKNGLKLNVANRPQTASRAWCCCYSPCWWWSSFPSRSASGAWPSRWGYSCSSSTSSSLLSPSISPIRISRVQRYSNVSQVILTCPTLF